MAKAKPALRESPISIGEPGEKAQLIKDSVAAHTHLQDMKALASAQRAGDESLRKSLSSGSVRYCTTIAFGHLSALGFPTKRPLSTEEQVTYLPLSARSCFRVVSPRSTKPGLSIMSEMPCGVKQANPLLSGAPSCLCNRPRSVPGESRFDPGRSNVVLPAAKEKRKNNEQGW